MNVLIGYFLVGISPHGSFRQIQTTKRKRVNTPHSSRETTQKIVILQSLQHGRARRNLPSEFYYPEYLKTSDVETEIGISESQYATNDFIETNRKVQN